jgi:VanZ family protein
VIKINIVIFTLAILFLSVLPQKALQNDSIVLFEGADKIAHFLMYASLMFLWGINKKNVINLQNKKNWLHLGILYCIVIGISAEIIQYYTTLGRSFELNDIIANISGTIVMFLFFKYKNY